MSNDVIWYGDEVGAEIRDGLKDALYAMALQVTALSKVNIQQNGQIDTGFMLNSAYAVGPDGQNSYAPPSIPDRRAAPMQSPNDDLEAIAGHSAEYTLYQEVKIPFLEPALEKVRSDAPGILKQFIND